MFNRHGQGQFVLNMWSDIGLKPDLGWKGCGRMEEGGDLGRSRCFVYVGAPRAGASGVLVGQRVLLPVVFEYVGR